MKSITQPLVVILHYREKCLNHSRLNEFSVVSINKAILISSMILRYVNLVMTIRSQKSFTLNHHLSAVEKYLRRYPEAISPIECLNGLGSAMLQNYPLTKGKYYVSSRDNNKEESRYGTRI